MMDSTDVLKRYDMLHEQSMTPTKAIDKRQRSQKRQEREEQNNSQQHVPK